MVWAVIGVSAATLIGDVVVGSEANATQRQITSSAEGIAADQQYKQDLSFSQLQDLMANPSSFFNSPVYKAAFGQGTQAVSRATSAGGFLGSGNQAAALQQYGQSFGQSQLFQQESLLAGMSGVGFNPASATGVAASSSATSFNQLGNLLASLGYSGKGLGSAFGSPGGGSDGTLNSPGTTVIPGSDGGGT